MMDEELRRAFAQEEMRAQPQTMQLREPNARELLESQLRSAIQEAADIRVVLAMLPTEPSPQQDMALRRLLTGGRR